MIGWYGKVYNLIPRNITEKVTHRASLVFAIQTWLAETPEQNRTSGTPSYLSVGMAGPCNELVLEHLKLTIDHTSHGRRSGNSTLVYYAHDS